MDGEAPVNKIGFKVCRCSNSPSAQKSFRYDNFSDCALGRPDFTNQLEQLCELLTKNDSLKKLWLT